MSKNTYKSCLYCKKEFIQSRSQNRANIYCNSDCHNKSKTAKSFSLMEQGLKDYSKKYLINHYGNQCQKCGITEWNNAPITIELEHIDGDSTNNTFDNLTLLCPNCNSQTPTYKNRNKGNGRHFRRLRYANGQSY